ncbi:MAG: hypothetical protein ACJ746_03985 [Bryobacteraceae bacterium]
MLTQQKLLMASLTLLLLSVPARSDSVYVITLNLDNNDQQFGSVDLGAGAGQVRQAYSRHSIRIHLIP